MPSSKNKKLGTFFIILPFATLIGSLVAFAIAKFVFSTAAPESDIVAARIVNFVLSLLGTLSVLGLFVFIPLGIHFLRKKDEQELAQIQQSPKLNTLSPEQLKFVTGWSWGAFFGQFIWALGNKLWLWAALSIIPIVNLYVWIKLSISGRKMSWEEGSWENFDQFKRRQKIMAWIIAVAVILSFVLNFFSALISSQ